MKVTISALIAMLFATATIAQGHHRITCDPSKPSTSTIQCWPPPAP